MQNSSVPTLKKIWENSINVNAANFYLITTENMRAAVQRARDETFVHIGMEAYLQVGRFDHLAMPSLALNIILNKAHCLTHPA